MKEFHEHAMDFAATGAKVKAAKTEEIPADAPKGTATLSRIVEKTTQELLATLFYDASGKCLGCHTTEAYDRACAKADAKNKTE